MRFQNVGILIICYIRNYVLPCSLGRTWKMDLRSMLRIKMSLFSCVLVFACSACSTPMQEVDDILAENNYTLEFEYEGCFGEGTETLVIRDNNIAIHTFLVFGEADKVKEKTDTIPWTKQKEATLREIFRTGTQSSDTSGVCSTTAKYILTGGFQSVAFADKSCRVSDAVGSLLK
jgi:hypothetical protein